MYFPKQNDFTSVTCIHTCCWACQKYITKKTRNSDVFFAAILLLIVYWIHITWILIMICTIWWCKDISICHSISSTNIMRYQVYLHCEVFVACVCGGEGRLWFFDWTHYIPKVSGRFVPDPPYHVSGRFAARFRISASNAWVWVSLILAYFYVCTQ